MLNSLAPKLHLAGVLLCFLAVFPGLCAQPVLLYEETFAYGTSGNFPVSTVGWANDVPVTPNRLYQNSGGDGAVSAYEAAAATTAFYTTAAMASLTGGGAFPVIDPASYPALAFSVDIQPQSSPGNVAARFAVEMNGVAWYAAALPLPVPAVIGPFATYSSLFEPSASNWLTLSVSGDGTGTRATLGTTATNDLAGAITGAGLVFSHTGAGTLNFDNFRITADGAGTLLANAFSNGSVRLSWPPGLNVRLQSATNLAQWSDLPETGGKNAALIPSAASAAFFRLAGFPVGQLQDGGFESGSLTPAWQTAGDAGSASLAAGGAYAGALCLQHSNASPYQVETWQLVTNLPNGRYKLTAWVQNSGGQSVCYLGGNDRRTSLPVSRTWTGVIVRGISVSNAQCRVNLFSNDSLGGNWCRLDFVQLLRDDLPGDFLKGGDISELPRVEYYGGKYYETNGAETDCLQVLKNHGCNIVRLRLYNDPGNTNYYPSKLLDPLGWQNPAHTLALAARAKALGFQILLTFHYSDYWSNGNTQYKPHDWAGLAFPDLTNALYGFTAGFLAQMAAQGCAPEYVSLGNEIQGGILFPDGAYTNWSKLAQLLNAGYGAVKAVSPSTKVVLHIANVDAATVQWFFGNLKTYQVKYDLIGCSYYPYWSGLTADQAAAQINQWYPQFNKPVLIMETGYNWSTNRCDGFPGQLANNGPEPFPSTPLGQKQFLLKCFNALKLVNYGHCLGDLYWDPVFICVPGLGWELGQPNVVDNTTLFDFTGHPLPALDAFLFNN